MSVIKIIDIKNLFYLLCLNVLFTL